MQISEELEELIEKAKRRPFPQEEREAQRLSFVYGNIRIENERVTREMVLEQAAVLRARTFRIADGRGAK
jgi:hypothetical protein